MMARMMREVAVLALVLAALAWAAPAGAQVHTGDNNPNRPKVEVVFVLDTTGSMSGLIDAAKTKVWSITQTMASAKPSPEIKIGLVAYRDRGDEYVTRFSDLSGDLDSVYRTLCSFAANGGGDTEESVNQALDEAVSRMTWSNESAVYKVIFLVGDCPPHMDYADDVKYQATCKTALARSILINAIQCGNHAATTPVWQEIATLGSGAFIQVAQDGGAVAIATPYDKPLAELSGKLDGTFVYYGAKKERLEYAKSAEDLKAVTASRPASESAGRGAVMAFSTSLDGSFAAERLGGRKDLVSDMASGAVSLEKLDGKLLPEEMQGKPLAENEKLLKQKVEERLALQKQITDLSAKRQSYIREELTKTADKGKSSLDQKMYEAVRAQAAKKGMKMEGGPTY